MYRNKGNNIAVETGLLGDRIAERYRVIAGLLGDRIAERYRVIEGV